MEGSHEMQELVPKNARNCCFKFSNIKAYDDKEKANLVGINLELQFSDKPVYDYTT